MSGILPARLLSEIEADVARYRQARINAALKKIEKERVRAARAHPMTEQRKQSLHTREGQASIVERILAGETRAEIAKGLGYRSVGPIRDAEWSFLFSQFDVGELPAGGRRKDELAQALKKYREMSTTLQPMAECDGA